MEVASNKIKMLRGVLSTNTEHALKNMRSWRFDLIAFVLSDFMTAIAVCAVLSRQTLSIVTLRIEQSLWVRLDLFGVKWVKMYRCILSPPPGVTGCCGKLPMPVSGLYMSDAAVDLW